MYDMNAIISELLLVLGKSTDYREAINLSLSTLGKSLKVDRTYIFQNHRNLAGEQLTSQKFEWCAPGIEPQLDNPDLQNFSLEGYPLWEKYMKLNKHFQGSISSLDDEAAEILKAQQIVSIVLVPLSISDQIWGFIGLDDCTNDRSWNPGIIETLKTAAHAIALVLIKEYARMNYHQARERLSLAFENRDHGFFEFNTTLNSIELSRTWISYLGLESESRAVSIEALASKIHIDFHRHLGVIVDQFKNGQIKKAKIEIQMFNKENQLRWVELNCMDNSERRAPKDDHLIYGVLLDIDEYKILNKRIEEDRHKLKSLLDVMPDMFFITDSSGKYLDFYADERAKLYVNPEAFLGRKVSEIFPDDFAENILNRSRATLETGNMTVYDYSLPNRENGGLDYFEARMVKHSENSVLTIVRDVSRKYEDEKKLKESKEAYEQLFEYNPLPMLVIEEKTERILKANNTAIEFYGYPEKEILSMSLSDLAKKKKNPKKRIDIQGTQIYTDNPMLEHVKKNGEVRIIQLVTRKIPMEIYPDSYLCLIIDNTDIIQTRGEMNDFRRHFDHLIQSLEKDSVYVIDYDSRRPRYMNNGTYNLYEIDDKYAQQNPFFYIKMVHAEDTYILDQLFQELADRGYSNKVYRIITARGNIRWINNKIWMVENEQGETRQFEGIGFDVTEEKNSTAMMQNLFESEKKLNESKSMFISSVSHQFRTPLATIFSSTELMERYFNDENFDKMKSHFLKIKRNIKEMELLLGDISFLNTAHQGKIKVIREEIELKKYCSDIIGDLQQVYNKKIKLDYQGDRKYYISKNLMALLLINLLENSCKYTPQDSEIILRIFEDMGNLVIVCRDNGFGISREDLSKIYEPFFRGTNVNTSSVRGTGLGLAIVKTAIDSLKGDIEIESEVGQGTTVTVKFNLTDLKKNESKYSAARG